MRSWSDSPFEPVTELAEIKDRGPVLAVENGESTVVYESVTSPGWLVKLYRPGFPRESIEVFDEVIAVPQRMPATDLALVDTSTCWPVSRVVDGGATVGVLFARAGAEFSVPMRMIGGGTQPQRLDLDQLVMADPAFYTRRDWAVPTPGERLAVATNLVAAGALFERYDLVYGDWSYANALWERGTGRVFVLDMDSCGVAARAWVESKTWDDPLAPPGARLTALTDRYKLAVLVLRCLSGVRGLDFAAALAVLPESIRYARLGETLWTSLTASDPALRPSAGELLELLKAAGEHAPSGSATGAVVAGASADRPNERARTEDEACPPAVRPRSRPADRRAMPRPVVARPPSTAAPGVTRRAVDPVLADHRPAPRMRAGAEPGPPRVDVLPLAIGACAVALALLFVAGVISALFH